jgi:glycosyltransferase involved in cell wall biosynthesis
MNIAFLTRVDAFEKNGGDTYQIQMYKKYLEKDGHLVNIITDLNIPESMDAYILVNLDRPIELIIYYKKLKKSNLLDKVFLLPIHHDYSCIDYYENNMRTGLLASLLRPLKDNNKREKLKNIFRSIKYHDLRYAALSHLFINYTKISQEILGKAKKVLVIAEGEGAVISKDFSMSLSNISLVKNGVDLIGDLPGEPSKRSIDILICGRIEPRKNSLAIAEYLATKNYSVVFVGSKNPNAAAYCKKFCSVVNASKNIKYLGRIEPESMKDLYSNAKVSLSASWFEVASLVDLEAYAYGCNVISSSNGHTNNYLGVRAHYLDPKNMRQLDELLAKTLLQETDISEQYKYIEKNYTWKMSSKKLIEILSIN